MFSEASVSHSVHRRDLHSGGSATRGVCLQRGLPTRGSAYREFAYRGSASRGRGSASRGRGSASRGRGSASRGRGSASRGRGSASRGRGSASRGRGSASGGSAHPHCVTSIGGHCSSRYASYWNAFLLVINFVMKLNHDEDCAV